jgi:DNA-binding transcriptional MerR regulator
VDVQWTLTELVAEAATSIATLPAPKNGQVRAVPDERTVRYYGTIGLLDRPVAMRGRTALYSRKHLAQVVAIKRLQSAGKSLAEIQTLWSSLDDHTLARMSGIDLGGKTKASRRDFWKREAVATSVPRTTGQPATGQPATGQPATGQPATGQPDLGRPMPGQPDSGRPVVGHVAPASGGARLPDTGLPDARVVAAPVELRVELEPGTNIFIVVGLSEDDTHTINPADVRAIRAAAAPLVAELARRGLIAREPGTLEET